MPGGGKGGKGGGEFTVDADVHVDPVDITTDMVIGGGERPVASDNTVKMGGTGTPMVTNSALTVGGTGQPLSTEIAFGGNGRPLTTESGMRFELVKPIVTQSTSDSTVDVKPLDVDLCLSFGLKELPATRIRRPYHRRFGLTLFGVEVMGLEWKGENKIDIEPRPRGPQVAWGPTFDRRHGSGHQSPASTVASGQGLRVTLEQ